jgi:tetratricopeptide (TPR) repeat protein
MKKSTAQLPLSKAFSLLVVLFLSLCCTVLHAAEYGHYDLKRLLQPNAAPATGGKLDLVYLDGMLADLSQHARNYPPSFDTPADTQRAQRDAANLIGYFGAMFSTGSLPPHMLLRMALLGSVAHNLDVMGGAAFAQTYFEKLLKADPAHAEGNYYYGVFLSSTDRAKEALPYLEQAKAKGITPALFGLGVSYLTLGDKAKALENLLAYQKAVPNDRSAQTLIEAIRSGTIETQRTNAQ